MKTEKILDIVSWAFLGVLVLAELLFGAFVARLNMLPGVYNFLLIILAVLLTGGAWALMFWKPKQTKPFLIRRCGGWALTVLVVLCCSIGAVVMADAYETISNITDLPPEEDGVVRSVFVLQENAAQTLEDAAGYRFGIVSNYDMQYTQKAIEIIQQKLGTQITLEEFDAIPALLDALYAQQIDALIISSAIVTILEENPDYADMAEKTRILYNVVIPIDIPPVTDATEPTEATEPSDPTDATEGTEATDPTEVTEPTEPVDVTVPVVTGPVTTTPFVVYIGGSDSRNTSLTTSRNDVNILAVVNPVTKQVLLVSTPRDYYIPNPAMGGGLDKLTHCGSSGTNNSIRALSALYGVQIKHTVRINFTGFEKLIDSIGGITVYSPVSFTGDNGKFQFVKGDNNLNGEAALAFVRERYSLAGGDLDRGKNQMRVIRAVIDKVTSGTAIIANYSGIMSSLQGMFSTSLSMNEISALVRMQLTDMASWEVFSYSASGSFASEETASAPGMKLSVIIPNENSLNKITQLMTKVMNGQHLTQADVS